MSILLLNILTKVNMCCIFVPSNFKITVMQKATQARDAEFISVCRQIIERYNRSGHRCSLSLVLDEALAHAPRCHYVSYDYASRVLHQMEMAGGVPAGTTLRRLRWAELYNQVKETMEGPRRLTFDKALSFVLAFRRPSRFYIDRARATRLLRPHVIFRLYSKNQFSI